LFYPEWTIEMVS